MDQQTEPATGAFSEAADEAVKVQRQTPPSFGGPPAQRSLEDLAMLRPAQPLREEAQQGGLLAFPVIVARAGRVCQRRREIRLLSRSKKPVANKPRRQVCECRPHFSLNLSRLPWFPTTEYSTTFLANRVAVCTGFGCWAVVRNLPATSFCRRHYRPLLPGPRYGRPVAPSGATRRRLPSDRSYPAAARLRRQWAPRAPETRVSPLRLGVPVATQTQEIVRSRYPGYGLACYRHGNGRRRQDLC